MLPRGNRVVGSFCSYMSGVLALGFVSLFSAYATGDTGVRWNPSIPPASGVNLVPNSSFELGADGWSSLGRNTAAGGDLCGLYGVIQAGDAYEGSHCLRIELGPGKTPVTHSDYALGASATVVQAAPLAATLGWMAVEPGMSYTLSAWLRADRADVPADLMFRFGGEVNAGFGSDAHRKRVMLDQSWARFSFTMVATARDVYVAVGPNLLETPEASVTVWVDAVQLEATPELRPGEANDETPRATPYAPRDSLELGFNSELYGNVFDRADETGFTLIAANATGADASIEVRVQLEDYFGDRSEMTSHVLVVPAKERTTDFLSLAVPGTGYYRAHLSWSAAGRLHTRTIKFSVIDTYRLDESAFGINHIPTTREACQQLRKAGVTWGRDWSMKWDAIEPREGQEDYAEIDRQVDRTLAAGMHLLPILPPQPSAAWASEAPEGELPAVERTAYAPAPEHREKLHRFIGNTVSRYKDRLTYCEFLNEPLWVPWYCLPTSAGYTVDTYIDLLKGASAAMKAADPNCRVIGGLSIMAQSALGDEFIQKGGLAHVDIYNLHPYPEGDGPESFVASMERIQAAMDAQGGRKPIWATELGYWGTDDKPWSPWAPPNPNHWSANRQQASEREAADYNVRESIILLAHGVEKIFWHSGLEGEVNNGSRDLENPLLDPEAIPQKFFAAQAFLANKIGPRPTFVSPIQKPETIEGRSTSDIHGYAFEGPDGAFMAVWAPGVLNNAERGMDGVVHLGESPVYLTSPTLDARALAEAGALAYSNAFNGWTIAIPQDVDVYTIVGSPIPG